MFCTTCGTKLVDNAKFCTDCGAVVTTQTTAAAVPSQPLRSVPPIQVTSYPPPQNAPCEPTLSFHQQINVNMPPPLPTTKTKWETPRIVTGIITTVLTFLLWAASCGTMAMGAMEFSPEMVSIGASGAILSFLWLSAGIVSIACRKSRGGSIAAGILYAIFFSIMIKGDYSNEDTAAMMFFVFLSFIFAALMIISGIAQKKQKSYHS
jgi:hypothetical protein